MVSYLRLTRDDKMLVVLRDELYGGSWELMKQDLKARLKKKPHLYDVGFGRASQIKTHLGRIQKLEGLETRHEINLASVIRGDHA